MNNRIEGYHDFMNAAARLHIHRAVERPSRFAHFLQWVALGCAILGVFAALAGL